MRVGSSSSTTADLNVAVSRSREVVKRFVSGVEQALDSFDVSQDDARPLLPGVPELGDGPAVSWAPDVARSTLTRTLA